MQNAAELKQGPARQAEQMKVIKHCYAMSWSAIVGSIMLFVFFAAYFLLVLYARSRQRSAFFQPDCKLLRDPPQDFSRGKYRGISYWYLPRFPERPTILFFHGSSGNISYNEPLVHFARKYEFNLFMIDYRGYGEAARVPANIRTGGDGDEDIERAEKIKEETKDNTNHQPTEESIYEDAQNAYNFLVKKKKIEPSKIIVWGNSMGGLAASLVASKNPVGMLVLWATFANPGAIITAYDSDKLSTTDKILYRSVKMFLYKMDIQGNLAKVRAPTVILHAKTDEVIAYENALINFKQLSKNLHPDKLKFIDIGGLHARPVLTADMWHQLLDFLEGEPLEEKRRYNSLPEKR